MNAFRSSRAYNACRCLFTFLFRSDAQQKFMCSRKIFKKNIEKWQQEKETNFACTVISSFALFLANIFSLRSVFPFRSHLSTADISLNYNAGNMFGSHEYFRRSHQIHGQCETTSQNEKERTFRNDGRHGKMAGKSNKKNMQTTWSH